MTDIPAARDDAGSPPDPAEPVEQPVQAGRPDQPEREWWDDPGLPWRHKPTRADAWCLGLMGFMTVYVIAMIPVRPLLLVHAPQVLGALGYRTGLVMEGALARVGDPHLWWVFLLAALGSVKFDWIYWWAGKLWGREILDTFARGRSERTRRSYERAWRLAHRWETLAIAVTFLPIPLPAGVIFASLGAAGTSVRKVVTVGTIAGALTSGAYLYLGWSLGEPAVTLVDTYGQWITWSSLALLAGVVAVTLWRQRAKGAGEGAAS